MVVVLENSIFQPLGIFDPIRHGNTAENNFGRQINGAQLESRLCNLRSTPGEPEGHDTVEGIPCAGQCPHVRFYNSIAQSFPGFRNKKN